MTETERVLANVTSGLKVRATIWWLRLELRGLQRRLMQVDKDAERAGGLDELLERAQALMRTIENLRPPWR